MLTILTLQKKYVGLYLQYSSSRLYNTGTVKHHITRFQTRVIRLIYNASHPLDLIENSS